MFDFNIVGDCCLWISGYCDFMVHKDEGAFICICLQPSHVIVCDYCRFFDVGWKVIFRKV